MGDFILLRENAQFYNIRVDGLFKKKNKLNKISIDNLPKHIAFIMDGNGRWAKKRGLPRNMGHNQGAKTLKEVIRHCGNLGVKYLTFYAFSTENWSRPKAEVDGIMNLLLDLLKDYENQMEGRAINLRVIGDKSRLSEKIQDQIKIVEEATKDNDELYVIMAINYGGRDEIIHATKSIAKRVRDEGLDIDEINFNVFSDTLYTKDIPDPDLLVRTSGEERISNYLLWQCAYSEFYFTNTLWPDFDSKEVDAAIIEYQNRNRRFGGSGE